MHIPSYCKTLRSQGCSLLNIKVGSEVNNLQIESTMWTYTVHVFSPSLRAFPNVGLQCASVSWETPTSLACNNGSCGGGEKRAWLHTVCACSVSARIGLENRGYYAVISFRLWSYYHPLHYSMIEDRRPRSMKPCLWSWSQSSCRLFAMFITEKMFLCLPTGFGKSVCYETLPFVFNPKGM